MNTTLDDGGPVASIMTLGNKGEVVPVGGLSIRDWLAGMAMQAIVSKSPCEAVWCEVTKHEEMAARGAYGYADAMLAARKEKP